MPRAIDHPPVDVAMGPVDVPMGEAIFRSMDFLDTLSEGLLFVNLDGLIGACNRTALTLLGVTRAQIIGRHIADPIWGGVTSDGTPFTGPECPAAITLRTGEPCTDVLVGIDIPEDGRRWMSTTSRSMAVKTGSTTSGPGARLVDGHLRVVAVGWGSTPIASGPSPRPVDGHGLSSGRACHDGSTIPADAAWHRRGPEVVPLGAGAPWRARIGLLHLLSQGTAPFHRGLPPAWHRPMGNGARCTVRVVGEPCAGARHARFEGAGTRGDPAVGSGGLRITVRPSTFGPAGPPPDRQLPARPARIPADQRGGTTRVRAAHGNGQGVPRGARSPST